MQIQRYWQAGDCKRAVLEVALEQGVAKCVNQMAALNIWHGEDGWKNSLYTFETEFE